MKKLFTTLAMATLLICALATTAFADSVTVSVGPGAADNVVFDTSTGTVTGYSANATTIDIPSVIDGVAVTSIADSAFSGEVISFFFGDAGTPLTSVIIPGSVTSIGDSAFSYCANLASITIPSSVTSIGTAAFYGCTSLNDVYYGGSQSQWDAIGIGSYNYNLTNATIHYNSAMADETTATTTETTTTTTTETTTETTPAATTATATLSSTNIQVNGQAVAVQAYMISDNNYIKLRDLATMINGTGKNFEVTWNQELGAIEMKSDASYTSVGGEMATDGAQSVTATLTTSPIYLDGVLVELTAYNIADNNYFKLRDVMELFDVGVGYDVATATASLDTSVGYTD